MKIRMKKIFFVVFATFMVALLMQASKAYSELANTEKVLDFLPNVIGLSMSSYNVKLVSNTHYPSNLTSFFDEEVTYKFESTESTLEATCHFKNNSLLSCFLYYYRCSLHF